MKTIDKEYTNSSEVLSSRFITLIFPLVDPSLFKEKLDGIKKEYKRATHYVYAYRSHSLSKSSDDKEPSGTAGHPILDLLYKRDIDDVGVVVVRYYGGRKLGSGRLLRTYVNCVNELLNQCEFVEM
ncbi:MAG: YigZ family protein [Coprobacillus sp.]|nr:YigZ family protein [Coprobacillus sp.]